MCFTALFDPVFEIAAETCSIFISALCSCKLLLHVSQSAGGVENQIASLCLPPALGSLEPVVFVSVVPVNGGGLFAQNVAPARWITHRSACG